MSSRDITCFIILRSDTRNYQTTIYKSVPSFFNECKLKWNFTKKGKDK